MSFANLKKNRTANFENLQKQLKDATSGGFAKDEDDGKYWKPTRDAAGNAFAVIRFLPGVNEEEKSFVKIWDHGFKNEKNNRWYIEKSLSTIGKPDPLGELNSELWNSGDENKKKQASAQKRRLKFYSNIYVIRDDGNPENNGKVFLYGYPKKIFDKINDAMYPEFDDETPVNPFDLWEGANFRLTIKQGEGGWPSYDKCKFDSPTELGDSDKEREAIYNMQHSLDELLDPKNFKTYDELKANLERVLGTSADKQSNSHIDEEDDDDDVVASLTAKYSKEKEEPKLLVDEPTDSVEEDEEDDDDDLAIFRNMRK